LISQIDWKRRLNKIEGLHNFLADAPTNDKSWRAGPPKDNAPLCWMRKAAHGGQVFGGYAAHRWHPIKSIVTTQEFKYSK
jgi:hypothetical protein